MRVPLRPIVLLGILIGGCGGDPGEQGGAARGEGEKPAPKADPWDLAAAVQRHRLDNGLTVLIREKHSAPVVTCELAFKVGAVDEKDAERGMAHFLEHMLFKGSTSFRKGEIDLFTMRNGGSNNAYTSRDMTAYHFSMPATGLEAALKILSEMLGQSTLDEKEFEAEKGPVYEELHAGQDDPWDRLWERAHAKAYAAHPYRHPIIGYEDEIAKMERAAMKAFYDAYYKPANAVLVIVGDVDGAKTLARVKELFGAIPAGTAVPEMTIVEPPQKAEIRDEMKEDVEVDRLAVLWRGPRAGERDDYVFDLISHVLGSGRTARLHQRLVEKDRVSSGVDTTNYSGRFPGTFVVTAEALPEADRAKLEAAVYEEIERLGAEGPTREELEKARNATVAGLMRRAENAAALADLIARFACTQTLEDLSGYVDALSGVTADEVKAAVKKYLVKECRTVCWSITGGEGGGNGGGGGKRAGGNRRAHRDPVKSGGGGSVSALASTKRVVLDNGLVLLLLENHDLPIFAMQTFARASQLYESEDQAGLANLVGLLLEDGTTTRSAEKIAGDLEFVGGQLGTAAQGVEATVLAMNQDLALDIVFDILMNSSFPEDKVELRRDQVLADIAGRGDQPRELARLAFSEAVYGRHPLHRPADGYADTVGSLTRDDCVRHYRTYFIPNNTTVAIAGDFDAARVEKRIREITAKWRMQLLDFPPFPEAAKPKEGSTRGVPVPKAKQVNAYVGHLGVRRNDPDWYALQVMDNVFSTGSGFTDRLSRSIRDEMGLAYIVGGSISYSAGIEPGHLRLFVATVPAKLAAARETLLKEFDRIRAEPVSAAELEDAKSYLAGSFVFDLETNADLADMMIMVERYGLGFGYPEEYVKKIRAVTAEDVKRVAERHLDPKALIWVVSGPVDEKGEPK
jgi:zinc protease